MMESQAGNMLRAKLIRANLLDELTRVPGQKIVKIEQVKIEEMVASNNNKPT